MAKFRSVRKRLPICQQQICYHIGVGVFINGDTGGGVGAVNDTDAVCDATVRYGSLHLCRDRAEILCRCFQCIRI